MLKGLKIGTFSPADGAIGCAGWCNKHMMSSNNWKSELLTAPSGRKKCLIEVAYDENEADKSDTYIQYDQIFSLPHSIAKISRGSWWQKNYHGGEETYMWC